MYNVSIDLVINEYLRKLNGESFIISVSGGMDSMALLNVTLKHRPHVVHFNHQVRPDSSDDVELVTTFCEKHQLSYDVFYLSLPTSNFQHEAHKIRKEKLLEVAKNRSIKHIFTAHHADDQTETILMRLIRGSDLNGYAGLSEKESMFGVTFHKPLLKVSKETLAEYIKTHHIPFREDSSNSQHTYFRNRIRRQIIPLLKQENSKLNDAFSRFHDQLESSVEFISRESNKLDLKTMTRSSFNQLSDGLKSQLLINMLRQKHIDYTFDLIQKIQEVLASERANTEVHLSNNQRFFISYDQFFIGEKPTYSETRIELKEGLNYIDGKQISIFFDNNVSYEGSTFKICYNKGALPLIARHRVDGDLLSFSFGHKKLKDYLIDKKIPKHLRDELLIIVDQHHTILWVEDIYINTTIQSNQMVGVNIKGVKNA